MLMNLNSKLRDGLRMTSILLAGAIGFVTLAGMARPTTNDAQAKGTEISARSDRSDRGFGDSRVRLEMVLRNAAGKESRRQMEITTLEIPDESIGDKGLIVFSSPRDIDGTALLSHAKILDPDDQWMYLPALKRVKRISSRNKSGPFVGSEFAFEDITGQELNKYEHVWLRTETFAGLTCDVIDRTPRYENSGYTKQIAWIDQTDHQLRKIEFYDRKGSLLKTLTYEDYRLYDGKYWRAQILRIVNHQSGKSTDLIYDEYEFGIGLGDWLSWFIERKCSTGACGPHENHDHNR